MSEATIISPLRVGAVIQVDGPGGRVQAEVTTYRLDGNVQLITAKDSTGFEHHLAIDLAEGQAGAEMQAVDIAFARHLALQVVGRHRHRMPVATEANVLAEAVIALTGGRAA